MRCFLPILLSLFIGRQFPATLEGDYIGTFHGFGGARWHFEKDGTFTLSESNCEGGRKGMGTYTIEKDSIHLLYKEYPRVEHNTVVYKTRKDSSTAGMKIHFKLSDIATAEDMVFVSVQLSDSTGKTITTAMSDIDGLVSMTTGDYAGLVHVRILYAGYSTTEFTIVGNGTHDIKVMMASNFGPSYVAEGSQEDYKLISMGKDKMVWQLTYNSGDYKIELTKE